MNTLKKKPQTSTDFVRVCTCAFTSMAAFRVNKRGGLGEVWGLNKLYSEKDVFKNSAPTNNLCPLLELQVIQRYSTWLRKIRRCTWTDTAAVWFFRCPFLDFSTHSSPLFSTGLWICHSAWTARLHLCLSNPHCPCHTVDCVVVSASWNLSPPQLGLRTNTSFLSQTHN